VWNRVAKCWLRIDLGHELEPTVEWLRGAIARQLGLHTNVRMFAGSPDELLSAHQLQRPIDYYTFGQ